MDQVLPIWQPIGYSTYQIALKIAERYHTKTSHTGVLDPLAEGVVIILLGKERLNKDKYSEWKKTYEFEITFGMETDSYDGMGLITGTSLNKHFDLSYDLLERTLMTFKGNYEQKVPLYSAVKAGGKKLFIYPKEGKTPPYIPTKKGEIYDIRLMEVSKRNISTVINKNSVNIQKIIGGEFRQDKILSCWEEFKTKCDKSIFLPTAKIKVEISRGMYIRSLSQDICRSIGAEGFVSELIRVKNGIYHKGNSKTLEEIFGRSFSKQKFISAYKNEQDPY